MKKIIIKTVCAILLMAFAVSAVACGGNTIYDDLAEEGYAVRVRFDVGEGGLVNETQNVTIVEAYNVADVVTLNGKTGIRILEPGDPARGKDGAFKVSYSDEKVLYFSPGWYTSRTETENGYVYSGRWDFEKDLLDPATLENGELVLYAAWIPSFTYEFYSQNEDGSFELIKSTGNKLMLEAPSWSDTNGKRRPGKDLPTVAGKTIKSIYFDEALTNEIVEDIDGRDLFVDVENGVATQSTIKIYITWYDEEVKKIFSKKQLEKILEDPDALGGTYYLGADIDLSGLEVPEGGFEGTFTGKIYGDGFKFKNLKNGAGEEIESLEEIFANVGADAIIDVQIEHDEDQA